MILVFLYQILFPGTICVVYRPYTVKVRAEDIRESVKCFLWLVARYPSFDSSGHSLNNGHDWHTPLLFSDKWKSWIIHCVIVLKHPSIVYNQVHTFVVAPSIAVTSFSIVIHRLMLCNAVETSLTVVRLLRCGTLGYVKLWRHLLRARWLWTWL